MKIVSLFLLAFSLLLAGSFRSVEEEDNEDWPVYLGGPDNSHYSPLKQIDKNNVAKLERAWVFNTGDFGEMQCNPIVIEGTMFGITAASEVFSLDAETGVQKWRFVPSEKKNFLKNRGVTYWEKNGDRRILCSYDEWLYALNADTGVPINTFGENGRVSLRTGLGETVGKKYLMSRTPGSIFEDLIIMPTVMMEDVGAAPGFLQAFNVKTGALAWVFHNIPLPGQFGADTWPADVHTKGIVGGANSWAGLAIDHKRGMVFAPTGSAAPDFFGGSRKGQNLFANTLLALDARTGKRKWHYQIVRHDIWDWDLPSPPNLTTILRNGKRVDVVVQLTKAGHIFVLDRDTGKPIFPVKETKVPKSPIPEESAWPTQPIPTLPLPIARQVLTEADLNKLSPDYDSLLQAFRGYRKGLFTPVSDVPTMVFPGLMGGAEWGGGAIDPKGIMYVNTNEVPWILTLKRNEGAVQAVGGEGVYRTYCGSCHGTERKGSPASGYPSLLGLKSKYNKEAVTALVAKGRGMMPGFPQISDAERKALLQFLFEEKEDTKEQIVSKDPKLGEKWGFKGYTKFLDSDGIPGIKPPWGTLTAVDLNSGAHKWKIPLGQMAKYKERGINDTGSENYGGPIVTASGLIFIAASHDNKIRAFDKENGNLLWEADLPASGFATPATYSLKGKQYVVVSCGGTKLGVNKGDALVAFRLP